MTDLNTLFRLDGRVALVAGAASGIGRAAAHGLAASGAITVCADLNEQGAASTAAEIRDQGGTADAVALDITDQASVDAAVHGIRSRRQRLDILVSTPAVNVRKPLLRYTAEEFEKVLRLNLKGSFLIAQAAGRVMSESKRGSIILFSSIRSLVVEPGQGAYAATKAGLVQLARAFAAELGGDGVRVNCIAPGVVETPLTEPIKRNPDWYSAYANKNALGRWATADEMAGPVVFLASDAASYITGTVLFVDGGWTAIDGRFQPPV
ncbi:MAG TPA: SDR family NAD(P)-dependent oxidoreductase [Bryobacteraceae bacterium]|nr:SDR family NAD(P)-dependent oxidoreductase [Bryobacteraceae bacterium]